MSRHVVMPQAIAGFRISDPVTCISKLSYIWSFCLGHCITGSTFSRWQMSMHMCFDEAGEEGMASSVDDSSALLSLGWDCNTYSGDLAILHNDIGRWVNLLSIEETDILEDCSHRELYSRQSCRPE
jgi:hypothetical protein